MSAALVALVLLTGCASKQVEYIEVRVECSLPPLPPETDLQWSEITGTDAALVKLEDYEASLVDSLHEHRELLRVICEPPENY
jgi:hypothetical protein